jgi:hypothetical protein
MMRLVKDLALGSHLGAQLNLLPAENQIRRQKMKTLKSICAAAVLALSLSIPAYADDPIPGIIHSPGMTTCEGCDTVTSAPGEIESPVASSVDGDISFPSFAEMLWALSAMF